MAEVLVKEVLNNYCDPKDFQLLNIKIHDLR